jgi:hypothetical protein
MRGHDRATHDMSARPTPVVGHPNINGSGRARQRRHQVAVEGGGGGALRKGERRGGGGAAVSLGGGGGCWWWHQVRGGVGGLSLLQQRPSPMIKGG